MSRVVWTPVAEADLDDILFYISYIDRNPHTGERIYYEIRDRVKDQTVKRLAGKTHPDAPPGWLYLRHKRWLVFYQPVTLQPSEVHVNRRGRAHFPGQGRRGRREEGNTNRH